MVSSTIQRVGVVFDKVKLGEILRLPYVELAEYNLSKEDNCAFTSKCKIILLQ